LTSLCWVSSFLIASTSTGTITVYDFRSSRHVASWQASDSQASINQICIPTLLISESSLPEADPQHAAPSMHGMQGCPEPAALGCMQVLHGLQGAVLQGALLHHVSVFKRRLHQARVTVGQLFGMMDEDRSDRITFCEFCKGVALAGVRPVPSPLESKMLFRSFDQGRDGFINYAELSHIISSVPMAVEEPAVKLPAVISSCADGTVSMWLNGIRVSRKTLSEHHAVLCVSARVASDGMIHCVAGASDSVLGWRCQVASHDQAAPNVNTNNRRSAHKSMKLSSD